jgi:Ca-activated chloride channel family protein
LAEPAWLLILVLLPLPWLKERARPRLAWPTLAGFAKAPRAAAGWPRLVPPALRALALGCIAVALARPQTVAGQVRVSARGVAIVVAIDRSPTMTVRDFPSPDGTVSRFEAARATFEAFVRGRPDDLIGLVAFDRLPETACPPTLDHAFLVAASRGLDPARPDQDGTNIGDAIAWCLRDVEATSPARKVVVLLSDGRNQPPRGGVRGEPLEPEDGARLARDLGVALHTIAVGPRGEAAESPDFGRMEALAGLGRGRAFVAEDAGALAAVFREIDRLETTEVVGTIRTRYDEWYAPWAGAAAAALLLDRRLSAGRLRRVP